MSPKRNRKGENSRRRKRTLLKKAYEYGELSGRSTSRQPFPPLWEQIVSIVMKYIRNANKRIAKVISTPG